MPDTSAASTLFILNDPPYGSERTYNGLRLAGTLARREDQRIRIFLMGDAATAAAAGQEVPDGYYNVERMLRVAASGANELAVCGSCMDARALADEALMNAARRGTMDELADWVEAAHRVLVF